MPTFQHPEIPASITPFPLNRLPRYEGTPTSPSNLSPFNYITHSNLPVQAQPICSSQHSPPTFYSSMPFPTALSISGSSSAASPFCIISSTYQITPIRHSLRYFSTFLPQLVLSVMISHDTMTFHDTTYIYSAQPRGQRHTNLTSTSTPNHSLIHLPVLTHTLLLPFTIPTQYNLYIFHNFFQLTLSLSFFQVHTRAQYTPFCFSSILSIINFMVTLL